MGSRVGVEEGGGVDLRAAELVAVGWSGGEEGVVLGFGHRGCGSGGLADEGGDGIENKHTPCASGWLGNTRHHYFRHATLGLVHYSKNHQLPGNSSRHQRGPLEVKIQLW